MSRLTHVRQALWIALCAFALVACGGGGAQTENAENPNGTVSSDDPMAEDPGAEDPSADPDAPVSSDDPGAADPDAPVGSDDPMADDPVNPDAPVESPNPDAPVESPNPDAPVESPDPDAPVASPDPDPSDPVAKPDPSDPVAKPEPVPEQEPTPAELGDAGNGEKLWGKKCKGCHGTEAKPGKLGPNVFAESWSKARKQKKALKVIRKGAGKMPAFKGKLSKQEMNDLVAFLAK